MLVRSTFNTDRDNIGNIMPDDITMGQRRKNEQAIANANFSNIPASWQTTTPWGDYTSVANTGPKGSRLNKGGLNANYSWDDWVNNPSQRGVIGLNGDQLQGQELYDRWVAQNTHADKYRTDEAYRQKWDADHGNGNTAGKVFNAVVGAIIGGGLASGAAGAMGASGGGAAGGAGATNPMGSGFTGTGPGVSTAGLGSTGAGGVAAGNALNPTGSGFTGTGPGVASVGGSNAFSANAALSGGAGGVGAGVTQGGGLSGAGTPSAVSGSTAGGASNALSGLGSGTSDWVTPALLAGSSLASGYLSNQATDKGIDEIKRQYDTTRADMEPWRQAGIGALDKLTNFDQNTITEDPMYQLANAEGLRAINRGNAARGLNLSGNALIDEARTGAAIATDYGNNVWNRQAGLAGVGQTATNALANLGQNSATNLANLYNQQGEGLNNALQGGINNYLTYNQNQNYRNPYMSPYSKYYG